MNTFGDNLRILRKIRGFEAADVFARRIGVDIATYYRYEKDLSSPATEKIELICKLLDCDPNYLFGFKSDKSVENPSVTIACNLIKDLSEPLRELSILIIQGLKSQAETLRNVGNQRYIESINEKIKSGVS